MELEKKYFYEFSLPVKFAPDNIPELLKEAFAARLMIELREFVQKEIMGDEDNLENLYSIIRFSTKEQNKVEKAEKFFDYLMENNALLNLVKRHITGFAISEEPLHNELKTEYSYFILNEEIKSKKENSNKRPKI